MSLHSVCFAGFEESFRYLLGQEKLYYPSQVSPLLNTCSQVAIALKDGSPESVKQNIRAIFQVSHAIFIKFQNSWSLRDQQELLYFTMSLITLSPNTAGDIVRGIEGTVVTICQVSIDIFEKRARVETVANPQDMLHSLGRALKCLDLRVAPLLQVINLYKRCTTLFLQELATCDEGVFLCSNQEFGQIAIHISELRGGSTQVVSHWKDLLASALRESGDQAHSYVFIERLLRILLITAGGVFRARMHLTPDGAACAHLILDSLDLILGSFLRSCHVVAQRTELLSLRDKVYAGFCGLYPTILIERHERQGVPFDPSYVFSVETTLQRVIKGLQAANVAVVPHDLLLHHYSRTLAFAVQQCDTILPARFEQLLALNLVVRKNWQQDRSCIDLMSLAWVQAAKEMHKLPSITPSGFKGLIMMITMDIMGIKAVNGYIGQEASDAFFEAADAIDSLLSRCGADCSVPKKELAELRTAIVTGVCDIQPIFALDWYEKCHTKHIADTSLALNEVLKISLGAFLQMDPKTVLASYASEKLCRLRSNVLHHIGEITDEEFLSLKGQFLKLCELWRKTEVDVGLLKTWGSELGAILHELSASDGHAVDAGPASKARTSPSCIRRTIELLTVDLLSFEGRAAIELLPQLIDMADELVCRVTKKIRASEQRLALTSAHEELFLALLKVAPSVVIDRLAIIEPGKAPVETVRRMERMLLTCDRLSTITDQEMRLFLLELFHVNLENYCYQEGVRMMPHPLIDGPTLCPSSPQRSPLHLMMEESMVMDDLDVACVAHCKDFAADPEKRRWVLFAFRWYLRKCIEKQRKTCLKACREWHGLSTSWPKGQARAPSLALMVSDPKDLYETPLVGQYLDLCRGASLCSRQELVSKTSRFFQDVFCRLGEQAREFEGEFRNLWPLYERGVVSVEAHIKQMPGYNRLGKLNPRVPVENGFALLVCPQVRNPGHGAEDQFFQPWMSAMMAGGEVGMAKAIAESLAPGNASLATRFLQELELLEEEGRPESPPSPVIAHPSPLAAEPSPKRPSPQTKVSRPKSHPTPKRKRKDPSSTAHVQGAFPVVGLVPSPLALDGVLDSPEKITEESLVAGLQQLSLAEEPGSVEEKEALLPVPEVIPLPCKPEGEIRAITAHLVEGCLQQRLGRIARRVHRWKSEFFTTPSADQYDRHTYPFQLINLIREYGERELWASLTRGRMNEHFVCIGMMQRYGRALPSLFGIFSEAFATGEEGELYHHDLLERTQQDLHERYRRHRSFFDIDGCQTPKMTTPFQERLFEKLGQTGSFFSSLDKASPRPCCNGRFWVQIGDMTVRVDDRMFGNAYTLALKVRPDGI